jgi:hypothetical protein
MRLTRLSLVRITPLSYYHKKILILRGSLSFQSSLLRLRGIFIRREYIDQTQKIHLCVPQSNLSLDSRRKETVAVGEEILRPGGRTHPP